MFKLKFWPVLHTNLWSSQLDTSQPLYTGTVFKPVQ